MEIFEAIVLGIIQGLGEFLPISSSGHLVVIPRLLGWPDQGLAFDVALHAGTLLAILIYFYDDWKKIISRSYFLQQTGRIIIDREREFYDPKKLRTDLLFIIGLATVPGILAGVLLEDKATDLFRNPILVGFAFIAGALLLFFAEKLGKRQKGERDIDLKTGMVAGLFQMMAIIPGMSRSGTTISAGLFSGLDRASAARFSFLLATPIVLGATVKELPTFIASLDISLLAGVLSAFLSGYLAIKFLLRYLEKESFQLFVIYRIAFALLIFIAFAR